MRERRGLRRAGGPRARGDRRRGARERDTTCDAGPEHACGRRGARAVHRAACEEPDPRARAGLVGQRGAVHRGARAHHREHSEARRPLQAVVDRTALRELRRVRTDLMRRLTGAEILFLQQCSRSRE